MLTTPERNDLKKWGLSLAQLVELSSPDIAIRLATGRISEIVATERRRTNEQSQLELKVNEL